MTTDTLLQDTVTPQEAAHTDSVDRQAFGFWLYLMSDLILFETLFATYIVLGHSYAGGPTGKELFDLPYVFGETMFLLLSSTACGMAMLDLQKDMKNRVCLWLAVTFLLGIGFIIMEVHEFLDMIQNGYGPWRSGFLSAFFTLVGTHGSHVTVGLIWMTVMMGQIMIKGLSLPVQSRLLRLSIFWHFLDIVWIGVFTVVYLMGVL